MNYNRNTFDTYVLKEFQNLELSNYNNCRITIEGLYGWGVGYYNEKTYQDFHTEVYNALRDAGYQIEIKDDIGCDYLRKEGSNINLYMHPMEFTGPASKEEIREIANILNSCECIKNAKIDKENPLYDLSNNDYRNMIYRDAENIALIMLNSHYDIETNYDAGFDFAEWVNIDRLPAYSKGGRSSADIDVSAVNDIRKLCLELKENTELSNDEIAQKVGIEARKWIDDIRFIQTEIKNRTKDMNLPELKKFYGYETIIDYNQKLKTKDDFTLSEYYDIAERNNINYKETYENSYKVNYTDNNGNTGHIICASYFDARKTANDLINSADFQKSQYIEKISLSHINTDGKSKILYEASNNDGYISEQLNYEAVLEEVLDVMEFTLNKYHDGYGLEDNQGGNLGNIESDRFVVASDIISRLDRYFDDYYFNDLSEEITEEELKNYDASIKDDYLNSEEWISVMNCNEDFKYSHIHEFDVMVMLNEYPSDLNAKINLDNLVFNDYTNGLEINPNVPCYSITSYYDDKFIGIESDAETYDWSKVEEIAHESLCKGLNVEIREEHGGCICIKADDYNKNMVNYDIYEFPYKAKDLQKGKTIKYKSIDENHNYGNR